MGRKKSKATPKGFVLDCSVVISWFFEDEADAYADAVEDSRAAAHLLESWLQRHHAGVASG